MEKVKASKQQNSRIKHGNTEDQPANEKSGTEYLKKPISGSASNNAAGK